MNYDPGSAKVNHRIKTRQSYQGSGSNHRGKISSLQVESDFVSMCRGMSDVISHLLLTTLN